MFLHLSVSHSVHGGGGCVCPSAFVTSDCPSLDSSSVRPPGSRHPPCSGRFASGLGGCLPQCMLGYTPRTRGRPLWEQTPPRPEADPTPQAHPPGSRHPLEQTPTYPPAQCMLGDTGNKRAVRILLECILV